MSPGIIFLDEPTSGLDAATAVTVVEILHRSVKHIYGVAKVIFYSLVLS